MNLRNRAPRNWIFLLAGVVMIRLLAYYPFFVEKYYSRGLYPLTSALQRSLTGWLPFSVGDLLYIMAGIWVLKWVVSGVAALRNKTFSGVKVIATFISISLGIYLLFNLLWGMNYNRLSVAETAGLPVKDSTDPAILAKMTGQLLSKTNAFRPGDIAGFTESREDAALLFDAPSNPTVRPLSMKPSMFGELGNFMGYSGYYNPISGEAQVNTYVPDFLIPFVSCHEMAHQAGYAKENEANFIGFIAARRSADSSMLYSAYFNMFLYANAQLRQADSLQAKQNYELLSPRVKQDLAAYKSYLRKYDSPLGTAVDIFYNQYLKLNQQPAGQMTYNRVVLWLLAYYEKYGTI